MRLCPIRRLTSNGLEDRLIQRKLPLAHKGPGTVFHSTYGESTKQPFNYRICFPVRKSVTLVSIDEHRDERGCTRPPHSNYLSPNCRSQLGFIPPRLMRDVPLSGFAPYLSGRKCVGTVSSSQRSRGELIPIRPQLCRLALTQYVHRLEETLVAHVYKFTFEFVFAPFSTSA